MNAKRLFYLLVVLFLIVGAIAPTTSVKAQAASTAEPVFVAKVETFESDLAPYSRTRPDANSEALGNVPAKSIVQVLARAETTEGNWLLLRWETPDAKQSGLGWTWEKVIKLSPSTKTWTLPDCEVVDKIATPQIKLTARWKDKYIADQMSSGCNLLLEGRLAEEKLHNIWVLRAGNSQLDLSKTNGLMIIGEGGMWKVPFSWNMEDFSDNENKPVAGMYVAGKKRDMKTGTKPYEWPVKVWMTNGQSLVWDVGAETPELDKTDRADFVQPSPIPVQGKAIKGARFSASIGTEGIYTVALIDGEVFVWKNSRENVQYTSIEAFMIPSKWTTQQIDDWIKTKWPNNKVTKY